MARYQFLNVNPLGEIEEDCVCRAISLALDEDYYKIQEKLYLIAKLFECESLCVCCYKYLLDDVYDLKRIEEVRGMTIEEFANYFPIGIFIVRVEGHLTCVIDNNIMDIWNCKDEIVDLVWEVK